MVILFKLADWWVRIGIEFHAGACTQYSNKKNLKIISSVKVENLTINSISQSLNYVSHVKMSIFLREIKTCKLKLKN